MNKEASALVFEDGIFSHGVSATPASHLGAMTQIDGSEIKGGGGGGGYWKQTSDVDNQGRSFS